MKVLQHTSAHLTIQEQLLGIWLLSISTICIGVFMFFLFKPPVDWIGAFCIALGSTFAVLAPTETVMFDKTAGYLSISQQHLLRRRVTYHKISNIARVDVEPIDALGTRFYRISLGLASGQCLAVTQTVSTDWQQQQRIVRHIRSFLGTVTQSDEADLLQPTRRQ